MNAIVKLPQRGLGLFDDFDHLFGGLFAPTGTPSGESFLSPRIDIVETDDGHAVRADLPGIDRDSLQVSVKDDVLCIEAGTNQSQEVKKGDNVVRNERWAGKYVRRLKLAKAVDASKISADYTDGVLSVKLPQAATAAARKIDVAVH